MSWYKNNKTEWKEIIRLCKNGLQGNREKYE